MRCPVCETENHESNEHCITCNYPFTASQEERSKYIGQMIVKKSNIEEANTKIKRARILLWIIGGFFILGTAYQLFQPFSLPILYYAPNFVLGLIFIGFGFLTYRLPIIATIIPLILITAYWVFLMSQDINMFIKGILGKVVTFVILVYATYAAVEADKIRKENKYLREV